MRFRHFTIPLVVSLVVSGCASSGKKTTFTEVWRNKAYRGPFETALVIGMAKDPDVRVRFENSIVKEFAKKGITATPGHELLPEGDDVTEESVKSAIAGSGIEVVLVTRLVSTEEDTDVVRGPTYDVPGRYDTDNLYGYYFWTATNIRYAPYYKDYTIAQIETNIYEVSSEKLIWTAMSELFDPKGVDEVLVKTTRELLASLEAEGWLG